MRTQLFRLERLFRSQHTDIYLHHVDISQYDNSENIQEELLDVIAGLELIKIAFSSTASTFLKNYADRPNSHPPQSGKSQHRPVEEDKYRSSMMLKRIIATAAIVTTLSTPAQAATWEYQGKASTGEKVSLNTDSIQVSYMSIRDDRFSYFFNYQIGQDRLYALTTCDGRFQTSRDGDLFGEFITPQSRATTAMLDRVCTYHLKQAKVISPPSNVRFGPSTQERIICSIKTSKNITTFGSRDDWFYTDACGKLGLIHSSQIQF